jgi:O-antigen/teichoic acid export membrane protein
MLSCGQALAVGLQNFKIPMIASLTQSGLTLLMALVIVALGGSIVEVVLSSLAVLWAVGVVTFVIGVRMVRARGARMRFVRGYARPMMSYVAATGLTGAGLLLFTSVDRIIVGAVIDLKAVTYYSVTIGIANKILYLADVATRPLLPASSALHGHAASVLHYLRRATIVVSFTALSVGIVMLAGSGPFLRWWLGDAFAEHALGTFRILIVVYAVVAIAAPAYHVINGIGLAWFSAAVTIVGGGVTLLLIAALSPTHGVSGAALANSAYWVSLMLPILAVRVLRKRAVVQTWQGSNPDAPDLTSPSIPPRVG